MSVLVIGPEEQDKIRDAIKQASARPIPWEVMQSVIVDDRANPSPTLTLAERRPGVDDVRKAYPSQLVILGTYHAAISFEHQPDFLVRHLSVSSHAKGRIPGPEVMNMVCKAFDFSKELCHAFIDHKSVTLQRSARVWVEEYEPGRVAINVTEEVVS